MKKSPTISVRNLRKLLNESLPSKEAIHLRPILEINDPKYFQQRAMEALNQALQMAKPDKELKLAITLLALARLKIQEPKPPKVKVPKSAITQEDDRSKYTRPECSKVTCPTFSECFQKDKCQKPRQGA